MKELSIAIHQPEHFPYMGFFQKMRFSDIFVILDNVKYKKGSFQNRNRFLNNSGKDEWFTVPVEKKATSKLIKDVHVSPDPLWRKKILIKFAQNLKVDVSDIYESESLLDINMRSIKWCMHRLGIRTPLVMASDLSPAGRKSELLANIVRSLSGSRYISGPSGRNYLEKSYFSGIEVFFFDPLIDNYYSTLYNIVIKGNNVE